MHDAGSLEPSSIGTSAPLNSMIALSMPQPADAINISTRSLQRKPKAQGTTFTHSLDDTRAELSKYYVRDPQRSLIEIAFLLGFSEPGSFSRTFKRWHGMPPSEYRESRH